MKLPLSFLSAFLSVCLACSCAEPESADKPSRNLFVIDYAHESNGTFYHATLSLIEGQPKATWTTSRSDTKSSKQMPITEAQFREIWDDLNDITVFSQNAVRDPAQKLDPKTNHIIAVIFQVGEQKGLQTYMIPAGEKSQQFTTWLAKIGFPEK
ncbi:MAG TPA: hypothetical protein PLN52_01640 [Opitutaceae bacterium]|nr:hypothetical protein [Opitutaceae bacterium]